MADPKWTPPPAKQVKFQIRLDADLADKAIDKAAPMGGLSAVVRAMLRRWVESGIEIAQDDVVRELIHAPRTQPTRRKPRKPAKD
jgi:hypothetical protein